MVLHNISVEYIIITSECAETKKMFNLTSLYGDFKGEACNLLLWRQLQKVILKGRGSRKQLFLIKNIKTTVTPTCSGILIYQNLFVHGYQQFWSDSA